MVVDIQLEQMVVNKQIGIIIENRPPNGKDGGLLQQDNVDMCMV